jgi:hypothetical protein
VGKRTSNRCVYYFEVPNRVRNYLDNYEPGVYSSIGYVGGYVGWQSRLTHECDRIWMQGPKGGIKIVKDKRTYPEGVYGYVTKNEKLMKEFMWIKLKSKELQH